MSSGETSYTFRVPAPEVLERGRAQKVSLEIYDVATGVLTAPTQASSTCELLGPSGEVVVAADTVTVENSVPTFTFSADDLPTTLEFSDRYQIRWVLDLAGLSSPREIRRACTVAPFALPMMVAEVDLTQGEYPRLGALVSKLEGVTLADFLAKAYNDVLERMRAVATWPEMVVDQDSIATVIRERALYRVFRAMAAGRAGEADRWTRLQEEHDKAYEAAWTRASSHFDRDGDGIADSAGKQALRQPIHINGAPRRHRVRDARW
jgi:hypothetical protein